MIEGSGAAGQRERVDEEEEISAFDAASYAFQIAGELSLMARGAGLEALAGALERVRDVAANAMIETIQSNGAGKPAPDDAA